MNDGRLIVVGMDLIVWGIVGGRGIEMRLVLLGWSLCIIKGSHGTSFESQRAESIVLIIYLRLINTSLILNN